MILPTGLWAPAPPRNSPGAVPEFIVEYVFSKDLSTKGVIDLWLTKIKN